MSTLHVLSHSPFGDDRLSSCLRIIGSADALLLSGDAVYALQAGTAPCTALQSRQIKLFVLSEDAQARAVQVPPEMPAGAFAAPTIFNAATTTSSG